MANLCYFNMCVKGLRKNIKEFYNALTHEGNIWIGRGAEADIQYENEEDAIVAYITGDCKWSIGSALITNAVSMRDTPHRWAFGNRDISTMEFITLDEASQKWDLAIEVYSEEVGVGFQEHYLIKSGNFWENECVDYLEYDLNEFETKKEAEEELALEREITEEEWERKIILEGGFDEWDFSI